MCFYNLKFRYASNMPRPDLPIRVPFLDVISMTLIEARSFFMSCRV